MDTLIIMHFISSIGFPRLKSDMTIFTARKRSLPRLCFHRFLSVHRKLGDLSREGVSISGGDLCPGGSLFSRVSVLEASLSWRGLCPGGVSVQGRGSVSRGGGLCQGVSVQGGLCLGGLCQETPHTVTCGRYAFYWNAFFLSHVFHFIIKLIYQNLLLECTSKLLSCGPPLKFEYIV